MSDQDMQMETNDQLVLIAGLSAAGKSASLRNIRNQENWFYMNTEAGKKLPFRNKFQNYTITDPYQVYEAFDFAQGNPDIDVIVIDTLTFLMDMFESIYVLGAADTQKAWGAYGQFFKTLMQDKVAKSDKSVIILAHTRSEYDSSSLTMKSAIPIKGALKNNGIEAYFSTVVSTKKIAIKDLEPYENPMLNVTEQEKALGFKHVFQTQITKDTIGERIRSPMDLFTPAETYIDNDAAVLLKHLEEFYA